MTKCITSRASEVMAAREEQKCFSGRGKADRVVALLYRTATCIAASGERPALILPGKQKAPYRGFFGLPPFLPFSREAFAFFFDLMDPRATVAGFFGFILGEFNANTGFVGSVIPILNRTTIVQVRRVVGIHWSLKYFSTLNPIH
jgi:hypothetical protein